MSGYGYPYRASDNWPGREVVDHVVEKPVVGCPVRIPVTGRQLHDRLLFAGGEEVRHSPGAVAFGGLVQPHAVVQVDHVDRRDLAVLRAQVRVDPDDEAVLGRLRHLTFTEAD